jgi:hypothetical protein
MDETGVTVHLTKEKQPLKANVLAIGGSGTIPPHSTSMLQNLNKLRTHPVEQILVLLLTNLFANPLFSLGCAKYFPNN